MMSKICLLPATADKQCSYLNTNYRQQTKLNLAMIGYYKTVYKENVFQCRKIWTPYRTCLLIALSVQNVQKKDQRFS